MKKDILLYLNLFSHVLYSTDKTFYRFSAYHSLEIRVLSRHLWVGEKKGKAELEIERERDRDRKTEIWR